MFCLCISKNARFIVFPWSIGKILMQAEEFGKKYVPIHVARETHVGTTLDEIISLMSHRS